jgi:hypothetical protein
MRRRLSPALIGVLILLVVVTTAAQNYSVRDRSHGLSELHQACPTISVSCPSDWKDGEPLTFTATVSGGNPGVTATYDWVVSAGRIIDGQGSPSIRVDMTGFGGQSPTGTVTVSGFDLACPAAASCSLIIERNAPQSSRFDSYGAIGRKAEIARLNGFAIELKNQPGAQGYLLVYGGRWGRTGKAQKVATRSVQYLKARGIDAGRIVSVDAGFKEELIIDLWLVPTGAIPPQPDPAVDRGEVKIRAVKRRLSKR